MSAGWPPLVELRRYQLHPGRREDLIELFERELTETQEAVGLRVLATFRDDGAPDEFVWLRGFDTTDPQARADALQAFYFGPVWAAHRDAANATMVDSDNVFLLTPVGDAPSRPAGDAVRITTWLLARAATADEAAAAAAELPAAQCFASADVPNLFPGLPVRDDRAFVALEPGAGGEALAAPAAIGELVTGPPHVAMLRPSHRSAVLA